MNKSFLSEPNDKQPTKPNEPSESVPIKIKDNSFHIEGIVDWLSLFVIKAFEDIKNELEETRIHLIKNSFVLLDLDFIPKNLSEEKKQEYLSSQHLEEQKCPYPYEDYLCVLRTYKGKILTNLVGTLYLSNGEIGSSQKIPIVSKIVLDKKPIKNRIY